jgi:hypothetical protein
MRERDCTNCVFKDVVGVTVKDGVKVPVIECLKGEKPKCTEWVDLDYFYETFNQLEDE